jgi:hypothetical protein
MHQILKGDTEKYKKAQGVGKMPSQLVKSQLAK